MKSVTVTSHGRSARFLLDLFRMNMCYFKVIVFFLFRDWDTGFCHIEVTRKIECNNHYLIETSALESVWCLRMRHRNVLQPRITCKDEVWIWTSALESPCFYKDEIWVWTSALRSVMNYKAIYRLSSPSTIN